jgi:hypothetical protein
MHCVRNERGIAITLVVRRLWRQNACAQPNLQADYHISAGCVRLALSTLFVSLFTIAMFYHPLQYELYTVQYKTQYTVQLDINIGVII